MSLILSIPLDTSVFIDDVCCRVVAVDGSLSCTIVVSNDPDDPETRRIVLSSDEMVAVTRDVRMCLSNRQSRSRERQEAHIAIDAPRQRRVLRETLYRKEQNRRRADREAV